MRLRRVVFVSLMVSILPSVTMASAFDHRLWSELLESGVVVEMQGQMTKVDYSIMARNHQKLKLYLKSLSEVKEAEFDEWPGSEQLAFLINAYNAWTVELVLTRWPKLKSIKDIGGFLSSPWNKRFVALFGQTLTLDEIEHSLIRGSGRYNDPRIHFAVNCASVGCPALRAEAYSGEKLETQLEEQTNLFFSDNTRNRLKGDTLELSSIFKWYREDFEKGWRGYTSLEEFLSNYAGALGLTHAQRNILEEGEIIIKFLDYDWSLNEK